MVRPPLPPVPPALCLGSSLGALALIAGALAFPSRFSGSPTQALGSVPITYATDVVWLPPGALTAEAKRLPDQKRPPCYPRVQVEWDGACWIPHASTPPCPEGVFEGGGKCLVPVAKAKPPNTSVGQ